MSKCAALSRWQSQAATAACCATAQGTRSRAGTAAFSYANSPGVPVTDSDPATDAVSDSVAAPVTVSGSGSGTDSATSSVTDSGHRGTRLAAAVGMLREWAKLCRNRCVGLALAVLLLACSSTKRDRPAQQTAESSDAAASSDAGSSSTATDVPTPIEGPSASGGAAPSPAEVCRPRDPDVESDACLGCLVRECCDGAGGPCLSVVRYHFDDEGLPIDEPVVSRRCYEGHFGCVRACFAQLQSSATQEEAWNAARRCADECSGDVDDDGPFPTGGSPATHLLRCVVGDGPAAEDTDGTDARCVAECLPEWPD